MLLFENVIYGAGSANLWSWREQKQEAENGREEKEKNQISDDFIMPLNQLTLESLSLSLSLWDFFIWNNKCSLSHLNQFFWKHPN